jgi:5-methylcytosine-specific restriction endonuclease McrA
LFVKTPDNSMRYWATRRFCSVPCSGTLIKKGEPLPDHIRRPMKGKISPRKGRKFPQHSGPNHHGYRRVEKVCAVCGKSFIVKYHVKDTAKYCSRACNAKGKDRGARTAAKIVRQSAKYKEWRTAVFTRDDYTCRRCNKRGGHLHAHHIKPFALFPELRMDVSNGLTLCVPCHTTVF